MPDLTSIAGAAAATTLVVAVLRKAFGLKRRAPQQVAIVCGILIASAMVETPDNHVTARYVLDVVLQGLVIAASAIGIHQGVTRQ